MLKRRLHLMFVLSIVIMILISAVIATSINVTAQTLETITKEKNMFGKSPQIKVGSYPVDIKVNPETNKIYVANKASNTISVIDSNSGNVTKNISVGILLTDIAVNSVTNKIYVANSGSNTISVIDGSNDNKIRDIAVGKNPEYIAVDSKERFNSVTNKIYVANLGSNTISVINGSSDEKLGNDTRVGILPAFIAVDSGANKIYVANSGSNTISVINDSTDKKLGNDTRVGGSPGSIVVPGLGATEIYVLDYDDQTVSVINSSNDTTQRNVIPVGGTDMAFNPEESELYVVGGKDVFVISHLPNQKFKVDDIHIGDYVEHIAVDSGTNKIYLTNSGSNTVSVVHRSEGKSETSHMLVGERPGPIAFNSETNEIYVANSGSNTVSVIDGSNDKVVAGVRFDANPANSGSIICNKKEYPINIYLYVEPGTNCTAKPNEGNEFSSWIENLNHNSTIPISTSTSSNLPLNSFLAIFGIKQNDASSNFNVTRYGTFTANFRALPPAIPPELWLPLYGIIVSSIVGWSIPSIIGGIRAKRQQGRVYQYRTQINSLYADGKLDENDIGSLDELKKDVTDAYAKGKITDQQYENLKNEISLLYEEIYDKKICSLKGVLRKNDDKFLDTMKNEITDAYAKGKISEVHYDVLNDKISKAVNEFTSKGNKDIQFIKRTPV